MAETTKASQVLVLAHVRQDANGKWQEHPLGEHLREVSRLASGFAQAFDSAAWAALAGLLTPYVQPLQDRLNQLLDRQDAAGKEGSSEMSRYRG
jgi:hypothetical protein